jgi:DNA-binding transcriptional LysR family regulator
METRWLEDFVSLAETRSFSRSAQLRHVSQPAFSRRIQALEAWAGVDLVDRSSFPTRLTAAGDAFLAQALDILTGVHGARNALRGFQAGGQDVVEFAVPHTLASTFVPPWLNELRPRLPQLRTRLVALNVHDAAMRLTEGGCDLMIAYHHPSQPLQLSPERYDMLPLGEEVLAPVSVPDPHVDRSDLPRFALPSTEGRHPPLLSFGPGAYMARLVDHILKSSDESGLEPSHEADMAESLKAMVLQGHGLAFLPQSLVERELRSGLLVPASLEPRHRLVMQVRIYRERPEVARHRKPLAQALWALLQSGM